LLRVWVVRYVTIKAKAILLIRFANGFADWSNSSTIGLTTRPSGEWQSYLFFLNSATGGLAGSLAVFVALPCYLDLSNILFSSNNGTNFDLNIYNTKSGVVPNFTQKTLPEKNVLE